jgi:hypothetical protein
MAVAFGLIGVWIVLLALPGLRRPPPGFEQKICPDCQTPNAYDLTACQKCGKSLADSS